MKEGEESLLLLSISFQVKTCRYLAGLNCAHRSKNLIHAQLYPFLACGMEWFTSTVPTSGQRGFMVYCNEATLCPVKIPTYCEHCVSVTEQCWANSVKELCPCTHVPGKHKVPVPA